jgi:hypothetical protein
MSTEEEEDMEIHLDPGGDSKKCKLVPPKKSQELPKKQMKII